MLSDFLPAILLFTLLACAFAAAYVADRRRSRRNEAATMRKKGAARVVSISRGKAQLG